MQDSLAIASWFELVLWKFSFFAAITLKLKGLKYFAWRCLLFPQFRHATSYSDPENIALLIFFAYLGAAKNICGFDGALIPGSNGSRESLSRSMRIFISLPSSMHRSRQVVMDQRLTKCSQPSLRTLLRLEGNQSCSYRSSRLWGKAIDAFRYGSQFLEWLLLLNSGSSQ